MKQLMSLSPSIIINALSLRTRVKKRNMNDIQLLMHIQFVSEKQYLYTYARATVLQINCHLHINI